MIDGIRIVITPGEPAGIGPDLILKLAQRNWQVELIVCASPKLLTDRAQQLKLPISLQEYQPNNPVKPQRAGTLTILPISVEEPVIAGTLSIFNSNYVLKTLTRACDGCLNGEFSALVTGPVHKGVINDAGFSFSGHTEFLSKRASCDHVVMMLATKILRVALATTHLPLKAVPDAITAVNLNKIIRILHQDLQYKFGITYPHILVCGLNPHAGEGGYIGKEEIDIIIPEMDKLRQKGIHLTGPLPADTLFQKKYLQHSDAILAMYHDQGLPVLKYHGFGHAVNITLGLPFIRTSVDHGTALTLAGHGKANPRSFLEAINLAISMIKRMNR